MILPEKYEQIEVRMNNAQWILPSVDERLTLISCWPYETNTHRLIVVARPLGQESLDLNFE
jgi:sortase A